MSTLEKLLPLAALAGLAGITAGCGEDGLTGPGAAGDGTVSLSVAIRTAPTNSATVASPNFDILLDDGLNTLEITRAAVVLREIELEKQFDECDDSSSGSLADDDSSSGSDDDGCEEFSAGPELVELPMDGSTDRVITLNDVDAGIYDEVELEVHKVGDDTQAERDFVSANPSFDGISIRVEGRYNGSDFLYVTDLNEEEEIHLADPIEVGPGAGPVNVTVSFDVSSWFERADGSLIDPATANEGGPNENLVEDNIKNSIEGFEDDDFDGEDDGIEDDGADGAANDDGTPDQGPGDN
jgi:hypothetical protein